MRYGFNEPQSWVHDLSIALCATGFFLAGPLAQERDAHIRLSAVQEFAPAAIARVCALLANLFTLLFLVGLLIAAVRQADRSIAVFETTGRAWDVPIPMVLKTLLALTVLLLLGADPRRRGEGRHRIGAARRSVSIELLTLVMVGSLAGLLVLGGALRLRHGPRRRGRGLRVLRRCRSPPHSKPHLLVRQRVRACRRAHVHPHGLAPGAVGRSAGPLPRHAHPGRRPARRARGADHGGVRHRGCHDRHHRRGRSCSSASSRCRRCCDATTIRTLQSAPSAPAARLAP